VKAAEMRPEARTLRERVGSIDHGGRSMAASAVRMQPEFVFG